MGFSTGKTRRPVTNNLYSGWQNMPDSDCAQQIPRITKCKWISGLKVASCKKKSLFLNTLPVSSLNVILCSPMRVPLEGKYLELKTLRESTPIKNYPTVRSRTLGVAARI